MSSSIFLKVPRVIRLLAQHGASALKYKIEKGRLVTHCACFNEWFMLKDILSDMFNR
jgi:hypothetical protein